MSYVLFGECSKYIQSLTKLNVHGTHNKLHKLFYLNMMKINKSKKILCVCTTYERNVSVKKTIKY